MDRKVLVHSSSKEDEQMFSARSSSEKGRTNTYFEEGRTNYNKQTICRRTNKNLGRSSEF